MTDPLNEKFLVLYLKTIRSQFISLVHQTPHRQPSANTTEGKKAKHKRKESFTCSMV